MCEFNLSFHCNCCDLRHSDLTSLSFGDIDKTYLTAEIGHILVLKNTHNLYSSESTKLRERKKIKKIKKAYTECIIVFDVIYLYTNNQRHL